MGEIANDMLEGFMCSNCGICFEQPHGYPVLCEECQKAWTEDEKKDAGLQNASIPEMHA
jgi:hypothetical protein